MPTPLLLGSFMQGFNAQQEFALNQQQKKEQIKLDRLYEQQLQQNLAQQAQMQQAYQQAAAQAPQLDAGQDTPEALIQHNLDVNLRAAQILRSQGNYKEADKIEADSIGMQKDLRQQQKQTFDEIGGILKDVNFNDPASWQSALTALAGMNDSTKDMLRKATVQLASQGIDITNGNDPRVQNWANRFTGNIREKQKADEAAQKAKEANDNREFKLKTLAIQEEGKNTRAAFEAQNKMNIALLRSGMEERRKSESKAQQEKVELEYNHAAQSFKDKWESRNEALDKQYKDNYDSEEYKAEKRALKEAQNADKDNFEAMWSPALETVGLKLQKVKENKVLRIKYGL